MTKEELAALAVQAMQSAYAPYSGCKVGAALLGESGKVYLGCNVENASFTPTICAERAAFGTAVTAGERRFRAIAVVGGKDGHVRGEFLPCGVCRQVMREFCSPDFPVYAVGANHTVKEYTLNDLLPHSFGKEDM